MIAQYDSHCKVSFSLPRFLKTASNMSLPGAWLGCLLKCSAILWYKIPPRKQSAWSMLIKIYLDLPSMLPMFAVDRLLPRRSIAIYRLHLWLRLTLSYFLTFLSQVFSTSLYPSDESLLCLVGVIYRLFIFIESGLRLP